jgi:hypothetical protein
VGAADSRPVHRPHASPPTILSPDDGYGAPLGRADAGHPLAAPGGLSRGEGTEQSKTAQHSGHWFSACQYQQPDGWQPRTASRTKPFGASSTGRMRHAPPAGVAAPSNISETDERLFGNAVIWRGRYLTERTIRSETISRGRLSCGPLDSRRAPGDAAIHWACPLSRRERDPPVVLGRQRLVGLDHQRRGDHDIRRGPIADDGDVPHHRDAQQRPIAYRRVSQGPHNPVSCFARRGGSCIIGTRPPSLCKTTHVCADAVNALLRR